MTGAELRQLAQAALNTADDIERRTMNNRRYGRTATTIANLELDFHRDLFRKLAEQLQQIALTTGVILR